MISKIDFINEVEEKIDISSLSEGAQEFWQAFRTESKKEKPLFTDNGKLVLTYLRNNSETLTWKAKDIAEGLGVASRTVSGAIRKLVNDGYVVKVSTDPVIYGLSDKGRNIIIEN